MIESTKATIEILEHYHHSGGFYEIPVEVINTVEQELEEKDKEIEKLNNIIKTLEKYVIDEQISEYGDTLEEAKEYLEKLKRRSEQ